ncbi:sensor histidine kinase [Arvimicrobium flavum]|uniref:sensor histidine kinase n=1 Tax=Arvimicrobium flavum TaxID=3393320 RepID=UPI00237A4784|nr:sensor histidine kinase [Mesorhizobium shangrilense]
MAWASVNAGSTDGQDDESSLLERNSEHRSEGYLVRRSPKGFTRQFRLPLAKSRTRPAQSKASASDVPLPQRDRVDPIHSRASDRIELRPEPPVDAVERERQRIARDLHDQAGQYFVGIMMRLSALEMQTADQALLASLQEIGDMVSHFGDELRTICAGQRVGVPSGRELFPALEQLTARWEHDVGIPVWFDPRQEDCREVDDAVAEAVYRVVQEALTNIAKHASNASRVNVRVQLKSDILDLEVQDNSHSNPRPPSSRMVDQRDHCGIAGMQARVAEVGGQLNVKRSKKRGTSVVATIPMRACETPTVAVWS